jgi:Flp pilus assembly protein TadG
MKKTRKGQAVVEMALVLPIFIFVLIGIFDFGRALHSWSNLNFQCVQAARAATKRSESLFKTPGQYLPKFYPTSTEVEAAFWKNRSPLMPESKYTGPTLTGVGENVATVEVRASFELDLYTPLLGSIVGAANKDGALVISAVATEQKEN